MLRWNFGPSVEWLVLLAVSVLALCLYLPYSGRLAAAGWGWLNLLVYVVLGAVALLALLFQLRREWQYRRSRRAAAQGEPPNPP